MRKSALSVFLMLSVVLAVPRLAVDLPFSIERQLLSQKQVLRHQRGVGSERHPTHLDDFR
jgi:hypothetical protein